jgi:hypothetical protein
MKTNNKKVLGASPPHGAALAAPQPLVTDNEPTNFTLVEREVGSHWKEAWPRVTAALIVLILSGVIVLTSEFVLPWLLKGSTRFPEPEVVSPECITASELCLAKGDKARSFKILVAGVNQLKSPTAKLDQVKTIMARDDFAPLRPDLEDLLVHIVEQEQQYQ